jgi:cobalt/nickel transport protein
LRYGSLVTLGLALFVAPFACPWPDGLEAVAAKLGFEHHASVPVLAAPVADYVMPGVSWSAGATALAGLAGVVVVFLLAWVLGRYLVPPAASAPERPRP